MMGWRERAPQQVAAAAAAAAVAATSRSNTTTHTVQAARWLVALLLVIGPIPKQLPPPRAARAAQSYLVRPEAICAPAFIDPSKVARRARLV